MKFFLEWFNQARTLNFPVNGNNNVTEKAHEIAKRLNIDKFTDLVAGLKRIFFFDRLIQEKE